MKAWWSAGLVWALGMVVAATALGKDAARWSFEGTDAAEGDLAGVRWEARLGADRVSFSPDVPGPYIYDPLVQRSRHNSSSVTFGGESGRQEPLHYGRLPASLLSSATGVTVEAFVRADELARGDTWLAGLAGSAADGTDLALGWVELRQAGQTWHGFEYRTAAGRVSREAVGHYSSSTRLDGRNIRWRHMALVYDASARTVTCWVDYHLHKSVTLESELKWQDSEMVIGGRQRRPVARGQIDEIRVVLRPLGPADFLRARRDPIEGVTFHSQQQIVPRDAGCLDAREHFGAAGDGRTDDTQALNAAFQHLADKVPLAYHTLILPPGEYLVSDMLYCSRFIDVRGAGPERTVIRLRDRSFVDPVHPRPVLRMSSTAGDPGSHRGVNGSSISLYLEGLTIDTGKGNPGAKALEYHANNLGRLENVVLRSGDGTGVLGLDLTHHDVGPALIKRVTVEGFDVGAALRYQEYSLTFEHVTLRRQRVVGLRNEGNIAAIRGLISDNAVPAIVSLGPNSMLTLLDSSLRGGASDTAAIQADGAVYALRVQTDGYGWALEQRKRAPQEPAEQRVERVPGPNLSEWVSEGKVQGFGPSSPTLRLPIEETPEPPLTPVSEWVNVAQFASQRQGEDGSPVVQAAIDSGARLIYFPRSLSLDLRTPIYLRGQVERLMGFGGELRWSKAIWQEPGAREQQDPAAAPPPLLIFDDPRSERVVVLDRLSCQHLRHESPGTLVLRSSSPGRYSTGSAGGRLFAEDVGGADWHFDHPQRVWVRQWNPESHAAGPCIHSRGATIWALGFKTEYESQKLLAENGAATEILGAFIYPIGKIPAERPIFENRNSQLTAVYGVSVYSANHRVQIREQRGGEVKEWGLETLRWAGSRGRMDLFVSDARPETTPSPTKDGPASPPRDSEKK